MKFNSSLNLINLYHHLSWSSNISFILTI